MNKNFMQNRELSWLKFNERVLDKGADKNIPLYERLKFISIFDSNLTEFFNVRVGSITDLEELDPNYREGKTNMTPKEQLEAIYEALIPLYEKQDNIYKKLEDELRKENFGNYKYEELNEKEKLFVDKFYEENIFPMISPNIIDKRHPFPFLENNQIYIVAELMSKKGGRFLILPIREALPKFLKLPDSNNYILTEEIVYNFVENLVPNFTILNKYIIRITRNADVDLDRDSEIELDYKDFVQKKIKHRRVLIPVRIETNKKFSTTTEEFLLTNLELTQNKIFITSSPIKKGYIWNLPNIMNEKQKKDLQYIPYIPRKTSMINENFSIIKQIEDHDVLLSYPYESMDTFLKLLKEAAIDERVFSIKITLYRVASNSKVIKYLLRAAEEGKEVTVLVELRARFDEENNIDYSDELIQGGVNVIYGMENYKVHTKICLISYKENQDVKYITHLGTGNYNESTAKIYQDMNVITSNQEIGVEASQFFNNMQISKINNSYEYLIQSPSTLKQKILSLMDREIEKGNEGYIRLKCNSVTDNNIMKKISKASNAGVKVDMMIRGICCIIPNVKNHTENVEIRSIVGRYLEHARIYQFGKGERADVYIASADLMTRNTERRVELGYPILDKDIKRYMLEFLDNQFKDTVNATRLLNNKEYEKIKGEKFDSHQYHMEIKEDYLIRDISLKEKMNNSNYKYDESENREIKNINELKKLSFIERLKLLFLK